MYNVDLVARMVRILLKEIELSVLQKILPVSVRGQRHPDLNDKYCYSCIILVVIIVIYQKWEKKTSLRDVKDSVFNPSVVAVVPRVLEFLLSV